MSQSDTSRFSSDKDRALMGKIKKRVKFSSWFILPSHTNSERPGGQIIKMFGRKEPGNLKDETLTTAYTLHKKGPQDPKNSV